SSAPHGVWIESRQAFAAATPGLTASRVNDRLFRIAGALGDHELSGTRTAITVVHRADVAIRTARIGAGELILQEITRNAPRAMSPLMLVIDGSARFADTPEALIAALDA